MAFELLKLAVLIFVLFVAFLFIKTFATVVWAMLDDIAAAIMKSDLPQKPKQYTYAEEHMTCDGCGSKPWHIEWDPECRTRKSRKFYCPNCTGAT